MVEYPPTSIDINDEMQDYVLTLTSIRTESLKISAVTSQKNDKSILPSGETTPLQKKCKMKKTKKPNK